MLVDPGDLGRLRVKKDVLYKPLLRGFRCFYRNQLSEKILALYQDDTFDRQCMNSTDPTRSLEKFCSEYLTSLQAPQDLVTSKLHLHSIIIMILPFTSKNMDRMLFKMPKVLKNLP